MRSIRVHNEFINDVELELGKRYSMSDDFYGNVEGILVAINNHYVFTDGDVSVHDIPNITLRIENTWDDRNLLIEDICRIDII